VQLPALVRQITEDTGAVVLCFDDEKNLVYATPSWLDGAFGRSLAASAGSPLADLVPPQVFQIGTALLDRVLRGEDRIRRVGFFFGRLAILTLRRHACDDAPGRSMVIASLKPLRSRAEYEHALGDRENEPAALNDRGVLSKLTIRQAEVLALVAQGLPGPQIARTLHRTPKAIEFHRQSIKEKLGFGSVAELTNLAVESGLYLLRVDEVGFWWRRGGDRSRALPSRTTAGRSRSEKEDAASAESAPATSGSPN
jgi:DNA-binding CsgD family transcriptional regulator